MPATQYPPRPGSVSGDNVSINRFLSSPMLIERALRTINLQRYIGDELLTERVSPSGGAIQYEQNEGIFPDRDIEAIEPGEEFPGTGFGVGPTVIESVRKRGYTTWITKESITRQRMNPVQRAIQKMANGMQKTWDAVVLAKINSSGIQTMAGADWTTPATDIIANIANAQNMIRTLNQGFEATHLVVDDTRYLDLLLDADIRGMLPREINNNVVQTGQFRGSLMGLQIVVAPNLPAANTAYVLDKNVLGGIANEEGVSADSEYQKQRQRWQLWAWRTSVPYVVEPNAAVSITGV